MPLKSRSDGIAPGLVSPKRQVPRGIKRPPYALRKDGDPGQSTSPLARTKKEMKAMRKTGQLAAEVLLRAAEKIAPGVTTDSLDVAVHEDIIAHNAYPSPLNYRGFPKSVCTSVNEVICHGIPDSRKLVEGDIINVDVTVYKDGVHGDTSATLFVGEQPDPAVVKLVFETYRALCLGIEAVKLEGQVSEVGRVIENHGQHHNLGVVREFIGHGIGTEFHTSLAILHYFEPGYKVAFGENMTFTIEPMLTLGAANSKIWDDDWTAVTTDGLQSAQFEHTLAIVEGEVEILTQSAAGECAHHYHRNHPYNGNSNT